MMPFPLAHDRPDHAAEHAVDILILSLDDALIADVEAALEGAHRVHHARSAALAIDVLTEHQAGVLLTDEAVAHPAFQKLARQLRQQFPSLIIVGVGEREAASSLIELVNNGQIYRFLLKPLSVGQVRLRVQSAARQHLTLRDGAAVGDVADDGLSVERRVRTERPPPYETEPEQAATGADGRSRRRLIIGGALVAVVAVVVLALVLTSGSDRRVPAEVPQSATVADAARGDAAAGGAAELSEVERSLDAASVALQEERYVDPVDDNALDHYLAVLEIEPDHPEAAAGLDTVAGVLLGRAQTALQEDAPGDALAARTIVQGIRPDHPDMALVDAEFAEHGRLFISRMNLAVAADDWTRAREQLDLAARFLPKDSPEVVAARVLLTERRDQFAINDRLVLANERMDTNSLTVPENDSAVFHLLALQADYPDNEGVIDGLNRLAGTMLGRADGALASGDYEAVERWLGEIEKLGVQAEALAARRESLANAQSEAAAALAAAEAAEEEAALAAAGSGPADAAQAPGAADQDAAGEGASVASTTPSGAGGAGAGIEGEPVEVSELEILSMVQPDYPRRAYVREIDGWIDVEFTVTETGLTRAIEVTGAKARGWFERAAIEAVEQWQFQPELQNGQPVERRAKVRLQFTRD